MIESNQLRIGNWIASGKEYNPDRSSIGKVLEIGNEERDHEQIYCECVESFEWFFKGNYCGIPITPSILEAAGLVLDGTNMYKKDLPGQRYISELWIDVDNSECWVYTIQAEDCWSEVMLPKCQYLHQLQNIFFALTGTELNITL